MSAERLQFLPYQLLQFALTTGNSRHGRPNLPEGITIQSIMQSPFAKLILAMKENPKPLERAVANLDMPEKDVCRALSLAFLSLGASWHELVEWKNNYDARKETQFGNVPTTHAVLVGYEHAIIVVSVRGSGESAKVKIGIPDGYEEKFAEEPFQMEHGPNVEYAEKYLAGMIKVLYM